MLIIYFSENGNWYQEQFPARLEKIKEAGVKRNTDKQISMASSKRYDDLKKNQFTK